MLYDLRVGHEIEDETEDILSKSPHWLLGSEEENLEERRQARAQAEQLVAKRQEKDLLDMLYAWRQAEKDRKLILETWAKREEERCSFIRLAEASFKK